MTRRLSGRSATAKGHKTARPGDPGLPRSAPIDLAIADAPATDHRLTG